MSEPALERDVSDRQYNHVGDARSAFMAAIELEGLTKDYGEVLANDGVTFDVEAGEIFGYLGPNGAGKTTTIRMLLGLLSPTAGAGRVLGRDITDERELIEGLC